MSGNKQLTSRRHLAQKPDPNADRLLGAMFEAVVPVGMIKSDREDYVASEREPIIAG